MNVNLLPQKFVKNRAMDLIIFITISVVVFFTIVLVLVNLLFQVQAKQLEAKVQQAKIEKVTLQQKVTELEATQSKDIQDFLQTFKADKKLMEPILSEFEKVAKELQLVILNYDILLSEKNENNENQNLIGADGTKLFQPITIKIQGDMFDNSPRFKEEIEKIKWVYDVHPISFTNNADQIEAEYTIRLKKEQIPSVQQEGEKTSE